MFRGVLRRTLYAIGEVGSKFVLHGLYLEVSGGNLTAVGTDGHRLVIERWPISDASVAWSGIVPKKAMIQLARQLGGADVVSLGITAGRMLHAHVESWRMTSRLIEGQYPNWQALAPKRPASNALTVEKEELASAIKRAALVADKGIVAVSYHDGGVTLAAKSPEHGEAHEEIHTSYCGHSFRAGFQADYLLDTLGVLDGDVVVLQQDGPTAAASIIDPAVQQSRTYVMPVRLP